MTDKPLAGIQYQVYRSAIPAVKIVTLSRLNRAVSDVQRELEAHGFYDEKSVFVLFAGHPSPRRRIPLVVQLR